MIDTDPAVVKAIVAILVFVWLMPRLLVALAHTGK